MNSVFCNVKELAIVGRWDKDVEVGSIIVATSFLHSNVKMLCFHTLF